MPVEELQHPPLDVRAVEAVSGAFDNVQRDVDAGLFERRVQELALVQRDERIAVAVQDQKRRVVAVDPGDRVGAGDLIRVILNRPADQE